MQTRLIACLGLASAAVLFAGSDTEGPVDFEDGFTKIELDE